MPTCNLDDFAKKMESIKFVLKGKTYKVKAVTFEGMEKVAKTTEDAKTVPKQLAALTGAPMEDFVGNDVRILGKAIEFVMAELTKQIQGKSGNPTKVGKAR